jgi:hypothetical protein
VAKGAKSKSLDFTKVKDGGGQFKKIRQPAGDYRGRVLSVEDAKSKNGNEPMWLFTIEAGAGKYPYYCQFKPNLVWKIRNLFVAAGVSVPKKKINVDPNIVVGKEIAVTLEDDEYDDKPQSSINSVFPISELSEDEGHAPEPEPKAKKKKGKEEPEPAKGKKGKKGAKKMEALDIEDM